jgi:hypothetical protein
MKTIEQIMQELIKTRMKGEQIRHYLNSFYCHLPGGYYRRFKEIHKDDPEFLAVLEEKERRTMAENLGKTYDEMIDERIKRVLKNPIVHGFDSFNPPSEDEVREYVKPYCKSELRFNQTSLEFYETFDRVLEETCDMDAVRVVQEELRKLNEFSKADRMRFTELRNSDNAEESELSQAEAKVNQFDDRRDVLQEMLILLTFPAYVKLRELGYSKVDLTA